MNSRVLSQEGREVGTPMVCGPLPKTLTLICDFPFPNIDITKDSISYLGYVTYIVYMLLLGRKAPSENISNPRPELKNHTLV